MSETGIGASVRRTEDGRFITGNGVYTDDLNRPGQAHAWIVRSPYPHAEVRTVGTEAALNAPGVVAILTGADMAADGVGGLPCGWLVKNRDGSDMHEPPHPPLATERVRHVGDQVAVVIAETRDEARTAAELVEVDYGELPAATLTAEAAEDGAAQIWEGAPNNVCYDWEWGDKAATDAAFDGAAHVVEVELLNNRLVPNAIEPRAAIGEYEAISGLHTLYTTSQNPHVIRLLMAAFVLGIPESKLRVVAPDVGGGFGSKIFHYAEEVIVTWAARKIGRPVKWTSERTDSFLSDAHGRDHVTHAQLALDESGTFLGLRVATIANMGAYLSTFASAVPTYLYATLLSGVYGTPAIYAEVKAVFTNTVPVDAYRGAGRPEANYVLERLVDTAATRLGIDRAELRKRNFIPASAMPYATPVALEYDTGDFATTFDKALAQADYAGFDARRTTSESRGRLRGLGISTYIEACGIAPSAVAGALGARAGLYESAVVRFNPTGTVSVLTGSHAHGQGHETTFAQVVSEKLGVPFENVEIVHGDTSQIPFGMGTYGSRSIAVGGSAIVRACDKIIAKGRRIAAHLMEASESDVEFAAGNFTVKGTDKATPIGAVAFAAYVPHNYPHEELEPGLDETAFYDPKNFTYPYGAYICEVEIDKETGVVSVDRFNAVDDFGTLINPMIVEGQVHGGLVQGIGQAMLEDCVYDESGQLASGSYMDYAMPRADDVPSFTVSHTETPCTHNPLGVKGCGEAGAIGAPAAVINAIVDALGPYGVRHIEMPATPEKIWRLMNQGQAAAE